MVIAVAVSILLMSLFKGKDRFSVFTKGYDLVRHVLIREDVTDLPGLRRIAVDQSSS